MKANPMYITRKIKAKLMDVETEYLDMLAREAGRCYSKTVSLIRKTHKQKGVWLSKSAVRKYQRLRGYKLHSQTVQAIIESYYSALKSYFKVVKTNPDAKPPKRTPKHFKVQWIQGGITYQDGVVRLSNGKDREPILIKAPAKPVFVEMYYHRGNYYFSMVYKTEPPPREITGNIVAVDMGEIHPIVSHDGQSVTIYNGRYLRSIKRYREKTKARFQSKMDRCIKRSNRWHRLRRAKNKVLAKLEAQLKDAEHKITSRFVSDCQRAKADTIVIGDLKGIRDRAKFGKLCNQKIHQWAFARIASMIEYKAALAGIKVEFMDESYTSQTCPNCGIRHKPRNRNYHCKACGYKYHRDGVGAINLWKKVSGWLFARSSSAHPCSDHPVVGAMASPTGVRFHWHLCKSATS